MESLGEKLKTARENKGYTYDHVGRETNIAGRYLEALEKEDFSKFPGEPYILGFLKNYGDYLGLDVQELLSLYRSLKIQEQAVPQELLLQAPPRSPRVFIILAVCIGALAILGGGVYLFFKFPRSEASAGAALHSATEYTLDEEFLERRFYRGDTVLVPLGNDQYKMELSDLGEMVSITSPGGVVVLDLSQDARIDLNNDGLGDVRITVADFVKNEPAMGAFLRFEVYRNSFYPEEGTVQTGAETPPAEQAPAPPAAGTPVIFSSPTAYPFTLQAVFQGYCMFRWESDRRNRNEQYFVRTDELNIQAQNGIRIWVSNAAAVKLQVIGGGRTVPLEIGAAGEVVVADVRWVRDDDGRFRLILSRLEQS